MLNCLSVTPNGKVQVPQFILGQRVCPALDNHSIRPVRAHTTVHHFLEDIQVYLVTDTLLEGHVDSKVLANSLPSRIQGSSAWEEIFFELMEADSHHSVGVVEGLLDAIAVMHVDVQVEHPRIHLEQLQDADHYVIDVAEATCLCLTRVVIAATPVYDHVCDSSHDQIGSIQAASHCQLTEVVQPLEPGAIERLVYLVLGLKLRVVSCLLPLLLLVYVHDVVLFGGDPLLQVAHIAGVVERGHFFTRGFLAHEHVQVGPHPVRLNEAVRHLYPLCLHRVLLAEVVVSNGFVVHVCDLFHAPKIIPQQILQIRVVENKNIKVIRVLQTQHFSLRCWFGLCADFKDFFPPGHRA